MPKHPYTVAWDAGDPLDGIPGSPGCDTDATFDKALARVLRLLGARANRHCWIYAVDQTDAGVEHWHYYNGRRLIFPDPTESVEVEYIQQPDGTIRVRIK